MSLKLLYTHPGLVVVTQMAGNLERAGIDCTLRNEFAAGAMGELAPIDAWPELWVKSRDWDKARAMLDALAGEANRPEWDCRQCGNGNPGAFEFCWHCGREAQANSQ